MVPHDSLVHPLGGKRKMSAEVACRLCERDFVARYPSTRRTRHHVVPQSWFLGFDAVGVVRGMKDAHANLVPLCRPCHDLVDSRFPVVRVEARRRLRSRLTQQEIAFAIAVRGLGWLDREYPTDPLEWGRAARGIAAA